MPYADGHVKCDGVCRSSMSPTLDPRSRGGRLRFAPDDSAASATTLVLAACRCASALSKRLSASARCLSALSAASRARSNNTSDFCLVGVGKAAPVVVLEASASFSTFSSFSASANNASAIMDAAFAFWVAISASSWISSNDPAISIPPPPLSCSNGAGCDAARACPCSGPSAGGDCRRSLSRRASSSVKSHNLQRRALSLSNVVPQRGQVLGHSTVQSSISVTAHDGNDAGPRAFKLAGGGASSRI